MQPLSTIYSVSSTGTFECSLELSALKNLQHELTLQGFRPKLYNDPNRIPTTIQSLRLEIKCNSTSVYLTQDYLKSLLGGRGFKLVVYGHDIYIF